MVGNIIHFLSLMRSGEKMKKEKGRRRGVSLDAYKHKENVRTLVSKLPSTFQAILLPTSMTDGWKKAVGRLKKKIGFR